MIYTALTKKAMKIAFEAHKNEVDKSGAPYICHPIHLAEQMKDEKTVCVALLHDVIEDAGVTPGQLKEYGFDDEIITALKLLTRDSFIPYMEYIRAIKENKLAAAVKIADLKHNCDLTRFGYADAAALQRVEKYKKALEILCPSEEHSLLTPEIEAVFKKFSEKYIVLMEVLYKDKELNEWCRNYSAYREVTAHQELREIIYGVFMKEAYASDLMSTVTAWGPECGENNFEKLIASTKADLVYGICSAIRMDYGSNGALIYESIGKGYLYQLMYNLLHYEERKTQKETNASLGPSPEKGSIKPSPYKQYTLESILKNENELRQGSLPGSRSVTYDPSLHQWRMTVQLEEKRVWFLSVFKNENGDSDKYSLDEETASDSHYTFTDEEKIRSLLYEKGDENRYLDEILIRYLKSHSGAELLHLILPYVTAQFHYD